MGKRLYILHISDTHYALPQEDVQLGLTRRQYVPGMRGGFVKIAQQTVLRAHGASSAERGLWTGFLDALRKVVRSLSSDSSCEIMIVHTGDVTQAGQPQSLVAAIGEINRECRPHQLITLAGNHDVWPRDFPLFAPSRTSLQARFLGTHPLLPASFPTIVPLGSSTVDLLLLDSPVADSAFNTTALGHVDQDLRAAGTFDTQLPVGSPTSPIQLRGAAMHHPPADVSASKNWWRQLQQTFNVSVGMVLVDAARVRNDLISSGVSFVLCGHEHSPPTTPDDALQDSGRLLVLQAGCPTLHLGAGNDDDPQFSLYEFDINRNAARLNWYICRLDPLRWEVFGSFDWNGASWARRPPSAVPASLPRGNRKPPPPFP